MRFSENKFNIFLLNKKNDIFHNYNKIKLYFNSIILFNKLEKINPTLYIFIIKYNYMYAYQIKQSLYIFI